MNEAYEVSGGRSVAESTADVRGTFIARTYSHLLGAIVVFTGIEVLLFMSGLAVPIAQTMLGGSWLLVLGAFMVVGWLASSVAARSTSAAAQYAALAGYVVAEAVIFVPLLFVANHHAPGAISSAAITTLLGFSGLSWVAIMTRKDFSFLGATLRWAGVCAILLIIASAIFGFELGTFFSVGMVALAGGAILYETSNVLHRYPEDRYVAASLALFASVALLFWYVLRLFMGSRR